MANKIDFSIIRERALRNIREDLLAEFAGQFDALEINDAFDAVLRTHRNSPSSSRPRCATVSATASCSPPRHSTA